MASADRPGHSSTTSPIDVVEVRTGGPSVELTRDEFRERLRSRFLDPLYETVARELAAVEEVAWRAYRESRKAPRKRRAGDVSDAFADPDYELSVDWIAAREAIHRAQRLYDDRSVPARMLIVSGSARSDQTCPAEISKTSRLVTAAAERMREDGCHVDVLDLSRTTSEYGRTIHPCKGCVSTAMPLCHWPCSCYPNHGLGQTGDWMNDIYPQWVAAHGILIVTPVYWYQAPTPLKAMIDRLVCADGGNPDPTSTGGKDPARAKALELAGWSYPRHLAGRAFGVVVHGDAGGTEVLRRMLTDWLSDLELEPAGNQALLDRYIGYYEPYATAHVTLDGDDALFQEVTNAARAVVVRAQQLRERDDRADRDLVAPRPK